MHFSSAFSSEASVGLNVSPRSGGGRRFYCGFTLIEFLAGFVVLVVLSGILMAAVGNARDRADVVRCASKLRQIGTAVHVHAAENGGMIVASRTQGGSASHYWMGLLAPYLGSVDGSTPFPVRDEHGPYMCPVRKANSSGAYESKAALSSSTYYPHRYLINLHISARTQAPNTGFSNLDTYRDSRVDDMVYPSMVMMFMDGFGGMGAGHWSASGGVFTYPHSGGVNVLYLDGHVGSRSREQIEYYSSYPYHVFWRGYDWGKPGFRIDEG